MPTKKKLALRELPNIPKELLEQFANGPMTAEAIEYASAALKKALIERALSAELGHHLGYPPGAQRPADETNQRNGSDLYDQRHREHQRSTTEDHQDSRLLPDSVRRSIYQADLVKHGLPDGMLIPARTQKSDSPRWPRIFKVDNS
jgi:hypothetical protein